MFLKPYQKRERLVTDIFKGVAVVATAGAAIETAKIMATPLFPHTVFKLHLRIGRVAAFSAVAVLAKAATESRQHCLVNNEKIRQSLSPGKSDGCDYEG